MSSTGTIRGLNKGYTTQKVQVAPRPASRKGRINKKVKLARDVIRDVVGLMPYEKRILDVIKTAGAASDKKVYKYAKRRLGTHRRALKKREEIKDYYGKLRAAAAAAHK